MKEMLTGKNEDNFEKCDRCGDEIEVIGTCESCEMELRLTKY